MRAWKVAVPIAAIASLVSCSPQSYEDCVLEALEGGVQGDVAAGLIAQACRDKFPIGANDKQLSSSQKANLTGRGGPVGGSWSGSLYNGNQDVTVTEVEIRVTTTIGGEETARSYRAVVHVSPFATEPMIFTIDYGKGRVFHTPMGHADYSMKCVGFIVTLQRGAEWAATGKVTQKIPDDFPTADKVSVRKL